MIASVVLTVGLVSLAQLFVISTMNLSSSVSTSGGVNDAQRLIEAWKIEAATNGITSPAIRTATYDSTTDQCAAFAALPGYDSAASQFKENVWVFDWTGSLVGTGTPDLPPGVEAGTLASVGANSRLVYVRLDPKRNDAQASAPITLMGLIVGK